MPAMSRSVKSGRISLSKLVVFVMASHTYRAALISYRFKPPYQIITWVTQGNRFVSLEPLSHNKKSRAIGQWYRPYFCIDCRVPVPEMLGFLHSPLCARCQGRRQVCEDGLRASPRHALRLPALALDADSAHGLWRRREGNSHGTSCARGLAHGPIHTAFMLNDARVSHTNPSPSSASAHPPGSRAGSSRESALISSPGNYCALNPQRTTSVAP